MIENDKLPAPVETVDIDKVSSYSRHQIREFIAQVEYLMSQSDHKLDVPITNHFSNGVYAREMKVPAGVMLVGKIHKKENLNILSEGEVTVVSIDGCKRVKAPYTFVGSPGSKRLFYMHENTTWTTIHGTHETDIDKIESEFIAKNYDELYLTSNRTLDDVLNILGFSREELQSISENQSDMIQVPMFGFVDVRDSKIHGKGLFSNVSFRKGDVICRARIDGMRTQAGRYSNHSGTPNAEMRMKENGDVNVVALVDIQKDTEILTDYYFNFINSRGTKCLGQQLAWSAARPQGLT